MSENWKKHWVSHSRRLRSMSQSVQISERFNWSRRILLSVWPARCGSDARRKMPSAGARSFKACVCVCARKEKSFSDVGLRKCLFLSFSSCSILSRGAAASVEIRRGANTCYVFIDPALTSAAQEDDGFSELKKKNAKNNKKNCNSPPEVLPIYPSSSWAPF